MSWRGISPEALFAAGYVLVILLAAAALEILARRSHRRAQGYHMAGFQYHKGDDRWTCPAGERLHRRGTDPHRRVVRYQAAAHVCNNCRIKTDCTDSDDGRSIEQELDSWLQSQIGRFHRGVSLTLMLLAGVILIVEALRHHLQSEEVLLYSLLGGVGIFGTVLLSGFLAG